MGQQSVVGLLRGCGCRLWQGRRLFSHEDLSRKPGSFCSSHSTTKGMWRHVSAERAEEGIANHFRPSKGFPTSNSMQAHIPSSCTPADSSFYCFPCGRELASGGRFFSSFENHEPLTSLDRRSSLSSALDMQALSAALDMTEVEMVTTSSESVEDFDFRNFPALSSSFFQGYNRPSELQRRKKCVVLRSNRKLFDAGSKLTEESIPQPKGLMYDFGLEGMPSTPPPLEVGARPQGRFDIDISLDNCEEGSSESPVCAQRITRDTPKADNLSEVSRDPLKSEDGVPEVEQEYWWDPYDFDAQMDLPDKLETGE